MAEKYCFLRSVAGGGAWEWHLVEESDAEHGSSLHRGRDFQVGVRRRVQRGDVHLDRVGPASVQFQFTSEMLLRSNSYDSSEASI